MVLSLSSDRFILLPPPPPSTVELGSGVTAVLGGMRLGLRCEMVVSGGLSVSANRIRDVRVRYAVQSVIPRHALSTHFVADDVWAEERAPSSAPTRSSHILTSITARCRIS